MSLSRRVADVTSAAAAGQPLDRSGRSTRLSAFAQAVNAELAREEEDARSDGGGAPESPGLQQPLPLPPSAEVASALAARAAALAAKAAAKADAKTAAASAAASSASS